jgi:hypothetical protein
LLTLTVDLSLMAVRSLFVKYITTTMWKLAKRD